MEESLGEVLQRSDLLIQRYLLVLKATNPNEFSVLFDVCALSAVCPHTCRVSSQVHLMWFTRVYHASEGALIVSKAGVFHEPFLYFPHSSVTSNGVTSSAPSGRSAALAACLSGQHPHAWHTEQTEARTELSGPRVGKWRHLAFFTVHD